MLGDLIKTSLGPAFHHPVTSPFAETTSDGTQLAHLSKYAEHLGFLVEVCRSFDLFNDPSLKAGLRSELPERCFHRHRISGKDLFWLKLVVVLILEHTNLLIN